MRISRTLVRRGSAASFGQVTDTFVEKLSRVCGEVTTNRDVRHRHGDDESFTPAIPPDAVVFASSTEEVQAVVRLCGESQVPLIPFGTGTSLEGHICADYGGVSLDLSKMDAILEVNQSDMDARVEAGCTRLALNRGLHQTGLAFMVDPGADASIGGMAACGASGTAAVRYGTMRETVLGLTYVNAAGEVVRTGTRARKSSAGFDLTRLMVGSEGALGVITEVQVRLHPLPSAVTAAVCAFDSVHDAASAAALVLQLGIPVARCELLDATTVAAFNTYAREVPDMPEQPHLFLEFHGLSPAAVEEQAQLAGQACGDCGGAGFSFASSEEERRRLWAARHSTYYAALGLRPPNARGVVTDACVPLSRLADLMAATAADVAASDVVGPIFGHAGDGNFHCILVVGEADGPEYLTRVEGVNQRLIEATLAAGGTCTGEHGVGRGKKKYLAAQYGAPAVDAMRNIKRALDPRGFLNPGKVVDLW